MFQDAVLSKKDEFGDDDNAKNKKKNRNKNNKNNYLGGFN